uniref:Uncharacterized protein n=1 Tax=Mola mola TaxID=94237 RepID=A0A3Q3X1V5_MOLML
IYLVLWTSPVWSPLPAFEKVIFQLQPGGCAAGFARGRPQTLLLQTAAGGWGHLYPPSGPAGWWAAECTRSCWTACR